MESYSYLKQFEDKAGDVLDAWLYEFIKGGATAKQTLSDNKAAFKRLRLRPRVLRDVSDPGLSLAVFGAEIKLPIGISPSTCHRMIHPDGEIAMVKAAQEQGVVYILGSYSTTTIEDVAEAGPDAVKWMQVYLYKDRSLTLELVRRAEKSGFKAIVVTVDIPVVGNRWNLQISKSSRSQFLPAPLRIANYVDYLERTNAKDGRNDVERTVELISTSVTWDDLKWLTSITNLPVVAKGILNGEDAKLAAEAGCAAVLVSNHGGRHLDGTIATIEVLPEVVQALKDKNIEIFMDGGINEGSDVFKAIALGAKMVFMGRQPLYGLAVGGQQGVQRMFDILKNDLTTTMRLTGCNHLNHISREMVVKHSQYSNL